MQDVRCGDVAARWAARATFRMQDVQYVDVAGRRAASGERRAAGGERRAASGEDDVPHVGRAVR